MRLSALSACSMGVRPRVEFDLSLSGVGIPRIQTFEQGLGHVEGLVRQIQSATSKYFSAYGSAVGIAEWRRNRLATVSSCMLVSPLLFSASFRPCLYRPPLGAPRANHRFSVVSRLASSASISAWLISFMVLRALMMVQRKLLMISRPSSTTEPSGKPQHWPRKPHLPAIAKIGGDELELPVGTGFGPHWPA